MSSPKGHLPLHKKNPESTLSKLLVIHAVFIYAECFAFRLPSDGLGAQPPGRWGESHGPPA